MLEMIIPKTLVIILTKCQVIQMFQQQLSISEILSLYSAFTQKVITQDTETLGWCPTGSVLPMGRRCLFSLGWPPF